MNFDLSGDQKLIKDSAHDFFAKEVDSTYVREMMQNEKGYTEDVWKKMAKLGWMGLLVPEQYGEAAMTFLDMTSLLYEMGYACFPGPFFSTSVVSVLALLEGSNDEKKELLLPDVARGSRIITLAWTEANGTLWPQGITAKAELRDDRYLLSGTKLFVPDAHVADTIICAARTSEVSGQADEGISLFIIDGKKPGLSIELLSTLAGDKQCEVVLNQVEVKKQDLLGEPGQGWPMLRRVLQKAAVAKCAEMCGGARKVLEMTVQHAKTRVQFDHPIGSFQAVQHHCANILTYVDTSTLMTYQTGWQISEGLPFEREASMCKAWVSDSYRKLVLLGHQVLGGTGFMEETDLQLYFKQAKAAELAFGTADFHRELVAQEMGL